MRAQKITLATLALVTGLTLTACQGDDTAASTDDAAPAASSPAGDDGGAGEGDGRGDGGGVRRRHRLGRARGQWRRADQHRALQDGEPRHLRRPRHGRGHHPHRLQEHRGRLLPQGVPGVDLKADSGPGSINANRSDLATPSVVLKTGESTRATLHYPANYSGGSGVDITLLEITPPEETHSKRIPTKINVPVSDSSTSDEVIIDPVGTGKQ